MNVRLGLVSLARYLLPNKLFSFCAIIILMFVKVAETPTTLTKLLEGSSSRRTKPGRNFSVKSRKDIRKRGTFSVTTSVEKVSASSLTSPVSSRSIKQVSVFSAATFLFFVFFSSSSFFNPRHHLPLLHSRRQTLLCALRLLRCSNTGSSRWRSFSPEDQTLEKKGKTFSCTQIEQL